MKLCPLLFFLVTLAKAIELESSKSEDQIGIRGGKFLVYTTTSTTTVFTSTLTVLFSTYRYVYGIVWSADFLQLILGHVTPL